MNADEKLSIVKKWTIEYEFLAVEISGKHYTYARFSCFRDSHGGPVYVETDQYLDIDRAIYEMWEAIYIMVAWECGIDLQPGFRHNRRPVSVVK